MSDFPWQKKWNEEHDRVCKLEAQLARAEAEVLRLEAVIERLRRLLPTKWYGEEEPK